MSVPAPYPSIDLNLIKNRTMHTKITKPINDNPANDRITKLKQDNSPSPVHYKHEESYRKTSVVTKPIIYSVPRTKKSLFTDDVVKLKSKIPGVGTYSPEKSQDSGKVTLGARGKIGYYQLIK